MSWGLAATATSMRRKSRQSYVAQMDGPTVVPKVLRSVRRKLRSFRWPVLPHGAYHPGDKISVSWDDPAGHAHTAALMLATGPAG
jgi:hypothetical protein